jgi:Glycosyl hydrolase family 3 N terminal domain
MAETSRDTDPDEAIGRLLSSLDLPGKVRLVTGSTFWTTQADDTSVCGRWSCPTARLASGVSAGTSATPGHPALADRTGRDLKRASCHTAWWAARRGGAPQGPRHPAHPDGQPTPRTARRRHFECLSEDPLLSGRIGAAYVRGLQAHGVAATAKHAPATWTTTAPWVARWPASGWSPSCWELLEAQRREIVLLRNQGEISNEVMHRIERDLDLSPRGSRSSQDLGRLEGEHAHARRAGSPARPTRNLAKHP